jgi:PAS domain S-box-containing protein
MTDNLNAAMGDRLAETIRVDLHCHSLASDATLPPEEVADRLSRAGVAVAALTDHDTTAGLEEFRRRLARRGIGFITGVEITTAYRGRELHLLAYGFDAAHKDLRAALRAIRRGQTGGARSLAEAGPDTVPQGRLDVAEAIALIHRAGGKTVLAHPLAVAQGAALREMLLELKSIGLDGLEALYGPYPAEQQAELCNLAQDLGLLVSAGSDWHGRSGASEPGLDMPVPIWRAFRSAVCFAGAGAQSPLLHAHRAPGWLSFGMRIVIPVLLATGLFVTVLFAVLLPAVERALLDRKRELIRELTRSACSILADYERQAQAGAFPQAEAQERARQQVKALRYGREDKDYFWIQDLTPRMIMHPYRPELDGSDLSGYRDPRGNPIFVEFADCVRREKQGYVSYVWQWQDDATRQSSKESYVQGFAPWGWVVGTGMYVDDVHAQLAGIRANLVRISLWIVFVVGLVLVYLVWHSLRAERKRSDAEEALRESNERYRQLVEAATEGTLLVADDRCRYANPTLRKLLGYQEAEMELLGLDDVLPPDLARNRAAHEAIDGLLHGAEPATGFDGLLRRRDGTTVDSVLSLSRLPDRERGFILMAREIAPLRLLTGALPGMGASEDWRVWLGGGVLRPETEPVDLCEEVGAVDSVEAIGHACRKTPALAAAMLSAGARSWQVTGLLSAVHDAAVARLTTLAQAELGPAPRPYAFLALGSFGRQEPTLAADQDNALVYEGLEEDASTADYFSALGARICNGLQAAGYAFCRGQTLAGNRRWCQPLGVWQGYFGEWVRTAEPRELMECNIFFDFRCVQGEPTLVDALRRHVQSELRSCPAFLPRFAGHSLQFKPPLRLFGRTLGGSGEAPGTLNLKEALMPIVGFARLYALHLELAATGTRARLDGLVPTGVLSPIVRTDIDIAWDFLTRLRLVHQVQRLLEGREADNSVPDRELPAMEQALLDQAFHRLAALQKMISHDFLGDT